MRSFMLALMCVACGGSQAAVRQERPVSYDTDLVSACVPEWQEPPQSACERKDDGSSFMKNDDPSFRKVAQIQSMEESSQSSKSMDEAIVTLTTTALADAKTSECGRQIFRWHRALALQRLGRWEEAFVDFGSVIKDGPNNPFYKDVGVLIDALAPHLPESAVIACLASYDAPAPKALEGKDAHWKPYSGTEPLP